MDGEQHAQNSLEQYRLLTARETGLEFGRGSYAAVVEVDYKGLRCAGKRIHRVLYEGQVDNLIRRFEEECRLLSQLRHPHIVQFMGIYFEVDTNAPVLVMEFLPTTLTQCLDRHGVMPEEINCSILQDVAVGLRYLHDQHNPIIHRDLSANNVLLTADMRAKISDLGVAKIVEANPSRLFTMTKTPGTQCYMPPETMVPRPRYSIKVDIFSYGVMMVHVLSGQWPFPGEAVRVNPNNPSDVIGVTEFGRREEYINLIGNEHPLMTLIQGCLSNSPSHRPTSSEVHQRVSAVAADHPPSFTNRVEMMERIKALSEEKETIRIERDDMRMQISNLQAEVGHLQVLPSSNTGNTTTQEITDRNAPMSFPINTRLIFTNVASMPVQLDGANLVLIKGNIYVRSKYRDINGDVLKYELSNGRWKMLPRPPIKHFSICSLFGKVLLVGGWHTGDIHEFDEASQQWVRSTSIPPMPTARSSATAVSWSSPPALIVCGGNDQQYNSMAVVEVYHSRTSQWHAVSPLPFPRSHMMSTVIHNSLFLMGGLDSSLSSTKSVIFTSVPGLLDQCYQSSQLKDSSDGHEQWQSLPDTPTYCSGAASLGGCLLAIGGQSLCYAGCVFPSIHAYSPSTSSWIHIGDLPLLHTDCGATSLPGGELFVVGGEDQNFAASKRVYQCSIIVVSV